MRTYEERMTEIRRRTEMLRKARRQRQRMVVCGLTAAACLGLVLWNPIAGPAKQALQEEIGAAGAGEIHYYSKTDCPVTEIRVSGMGEERIVQDTEKILHFLVLARLDTSAGMLQDSAMPRETAPAENCDIMGGTRGENTVFPAGGQSEDDIDANQTEAVSENSEGEQKNNATGILSDHQDPGYAVRLILESGEEIQYFLTEEGLLNSKTGAAISLDQNQRQLMLELLEIG